MTIRGRKGAESGSEVHESIVRRHGCLLLLRKLRRIEIVIRFAQTFILHSPLRRAPVLLKHLVLLQEKGAQLRVELHHVRIRRGFLIVGSLRAEYILHSLLCNGDVIERVVGVDCCSLCLVLLLPSVLAEHGSR